MKLDKYQSKAVNAKDAKVSVLAGPGSGKTRTIIARIEKLLETEDASKIFCITFTNSAAETIKQRLTKKIGYVGTLHSLCLRKILNNTLYTALLPEDFALSHFSDICKDYDIPHNKKYIENLKRNLYQIRTGSDTNSTHQMIFQRYMQFLMEMKAVCYDSALDIFHAALQVDGFDIKIDHLLVDEFQDSNDIDFLIYNDLNPKNCFFVGDPRQSIFAFRGANPDLMIQLKNRGYKEYTLEKNYRSSELICTFSNALHKDYPSMKPAKKTKGKTKCIEFESDYDEMHYISNLVSKKKDLAILCRTNNQAWIIKEFLSKFGLNFHSGYNDSNHEMRKSVLLLLDLLISDYSPTIKYILAKRVFSGKSDYYINEKLKLDAFYQKKGEKSIPDYLLLNGIDMNYVSFLIQAIEDFHDLDPFDLRNAIDELNSKKKVDDCYVGTMHSSKSMEFDHVIIPFCYDGNVPLTEDEQELNLFYVALTRARKTCTFTYSEINENSDLYGESDSFKYKSRFLENI